MKVLITGGAGYIGSTIGSALLDHGHTPIILDSLVTGQAAFTQGRIFYKGDIADRDMVAQIFKDHPDITATIHCAALIVVPESVEQPYEYYRENVVKSMDFFYQLARWVTPGWCSALLRQFMMWYPVSWSPRIHPSTPAALMHAPST
jgi:UDP-glucose 4-epimerase